MLLKVVLNTKNLIKIKYKFKHNGEQVYIWWKLDYGLSNNDKQM
jgi:hypothetical protein